MDLEIYTDGACSGNPGPGGWAFVMIENAQIVREQWGAEQNTTNNRMELTAVLSALEAAQGLLAASGEARQPVRIYTDSQYVQKGITQWIQTWKRNGWRTSAKAPVKNQDLWRLLDEYHGAMAIQWGWVKGHAGNPFNEQCDRLTKVAIASLDAR